MTKYKLIQTKNQQPDVRTKQGPTNSYTLLHLTYCFQVKS